MPLEKSTVPNRKIEGQGGLTLEERRLGSGKLKASKWGKRLAPAVTSGNAAIYHTKLTAE